MTVAVVVALCAGSVVWSLWQLLVSLPRQRRRLEEIDRQVREWERGPE